MYDIAGWFFSPLPGPSWNDPTPIPLALECISHLAFAVPTSRSRCQCIEIIRYYKSYRLWWGNALCSAYLIISCNLFAFLSTQNICDLVATPSPPSLQPSGFSFRVTKSSLTCELSVCHSLWKLHADTNVAKRYTLVCVTYVSTGYTLSSWDAKVFARFMRGCCFIYKILMFL